MLARNVSRTREIRSACSILAEYPEGKRPTEGLKHTYRLEDNIKMDRRGIWRAEVATIYAVNRIAVLMLRQIIQNVISYSICYEFSFS
jgi:hypothetical protein